MCCGQCTGLAFRSLARFAGPDLSLRALNRFGAAGSSIGRMWWLKRTVGVLWLVSACAPGDDAPMTFEPLFDPPSTTEAKEPEPFAQAAMAVDASILAPSYEGWAKIGDVEADTAVGIYGFDVEQNLALISPWGHMVDLDRVDYEPEKADADPYWTGVMRRGVGEHEVGDEVGVWAFTTTDEHGGWVVLGGPDTIEVVSARDVLVDGTLVLDGHFSDDRIEMLEVLGEGIDADFSAGFAGPWAGDVFAGNINQTMWQRDSGRHPVDDEGRAGGWWGKANSIFVVWPLVSAIADGHPAFADVRVIQDPDVALLEGDPCGAMACTDLWMIAIDEVEEQRDRFEAGEIDTKAEEVEATRLIHESFWEAHTAIADVAVARTEPFLATLPEREQEFVIAWGAVMVHFLGEANFPLTREFQETFNPILPQALVTDAALAGNGELGLPEIAIARMVMSLAAANEASRGVLLAAFSAAADKAERAGAFEAAYQALQWLIEGGCQSVAECRDDMHHLIQCGFELEC
jgi:hypothetical protein